MELRRYALIVWRWSWLVVLGTVIAAGASYVVCKRMVPVYRATTMLMVSQSKAQLMDASVLPNTDRLAATDAELLHRQPVLDEVIQRLGLKTTAVALARSVTVQPLRNTQLIQLNVEDTDPARAAAIANEMPKVFIQQNNAMQTSRFADSEASLQKQIQGVQVEMAQLQASLAGLRAASPQNQAEIDSQQRDLSEKQTTYANLYSSYDQLRMDEANQLDTLVITEQAQTPLLPIRPKTLQNTLLAAVLGAMLALGLAYLVEYFDDVIKSPDEVEQVLGLTTLSVVPAVAEGSAAGELPVLSSPHSAVTEAYRVLRTNLQFASIDAALRTLLVTSASPGEGKSMTAANLGAALAQDGKRVILVDADLHRPHLQVVFKTSNNTGVTTALLAGKADLDNLLQDSGVAGLRVLTSGPLPPNAAELLGSGHMRQLLADLAARCDIVILDSPPTMALADAAILATRVDGVLLVLDATNTRREMAKRAVAGLQQVQARLIGAVINRVPTRGAGSYYYQPYNQYGEYFDQDGSSGNGRGGQRGSRGSGGNGFVHRLRHGLRSPTGDRRPGQAPALSAARDADERV